MPFIAEVGDAVETHGEVTVEWKIRDFFALSDKVDDCYDSPVFTFADTRWCLRLYPNGKTTNSSSGWVSLYLWRKNSGPVKTVNYTFGFKGSDGEKKEVELKYEFSLNVGHGFTKSWSRSELKKEISEVKPKNLLIITCHLKCSDPNTANVSLSNRVRKVSVSMKTILDEGKRSDFTLKLGDNEWPVHKVILENRCEYFENMFRHEWVENTVGEVKFDDMEKDALDSVLEFIYSGEANMSTKNVFEIYVAAHKFLLDDLKALCIEYMKENMCAEIVCKVLVIADTYEEKDLNESAIEYFNRDADEIFDSEEWKELKKNHLSIATELLEEITKRERKKKRSKECEGF